VLILIGILGCIVVMLLPAIQSAREAARRTTCLNNLKQLGFAVGAYESAHGKFPPSSGVTRNANGAITAVDGWSWVIAVLPYWTQFADPHGSAPVAKKLYDRLDIAHGRPLAEPASAEGTPHADALAVSLPELLCPSYHGSPYADPATKMAAITNYRAMGATHIESLSVASPHPLTPKYGADSLAGRRSTRDTSLLHPDGACFPGEGLNPGKFDKGVYCTIVSVESIEPRFSRWTVGEEAAVVGFPPNVEFEKDLYDGCTPKGYREAMRESPDVEGTYWTYRTYLEWDYDRNPYDGDDGAQGGRYGPSSGHPHVVNHLFADGHAVSMPRSIDLIFYMFLITHDQVTPNGWNDDGK
jgi:hypothetical protein